jgi:hypothetical protein
MPSDDLPASRLTPLAQKCSLGLNAAQTPGLKALRGKARAEADWGRLAFSGGADKVMQHVQVHKDDQWTRVGCC